MKGRPRKPTAALEASGAFQKHPERKAERENEPESNGPIGDPPAYFDRYHCDVWRELIRKAPKGVLSLSDAPHLEIATRLMVKMRLAPARMPKWLKLLGESLVEAGAGPDLVDEMREAFRAVLGINGQELALLGACLTRMGMTPADRSRVHGAKEKGDKPDPFAEAMRNLGRGAQIPQ